MKLLKQQNQQQQINQKYQNNTIEDPLGLFHLRYLQQYMQSRVASEHQVYIKLKNKNIQKKITNLDTNSCNN